MTDQLSKLSILLALSLMGLATTLAIQDFQTEQAYQAASAGAYLAMLTPAPSPLPLPPAPPTDTALSLKEGWNAVNVTLPVALEDIGQCAIGSPAYELVDNEYEAVSTLEPHHSYWVWANAACEAELP